MQRTLSVHSAVGSNGKIVGTSRKEESPRARLLRLVLVIALVVVAITGFFTAACTFHFFGPGTTTCWVRPTNLPASSTYFVVVMANEGMNVGFNGSKVPSGSWAIMEVKLGGSVSLHVLNNCT